MLPRSGGVLDQPDREVRVLEVILGAFGKYEEREQKKRELREKNRERHQQPNRRIEA